MDKVFFALLEGPDDKRFFDKILLPKLSQKYDKIYTYLYAGIHQKTLERFVASLNKSNFDYVIFSDLDSFTCFTLGKDSLLRKISTSNPSKIAISQIEIESWYLAGLSYKNSRSLQIPYYPTTDDISKERFNSIIPDLYDSRTDFMQEILKKFDSNLAKTQNTSFRYVWNKFIF